MNKTHIVIHHSATADGVSLDWGALRDYHVQVNGWRDIGYHAGIEAHKGALTVLLGRPLHWDGAHAGVGHWNKVALGFCFVGNFSMYAPPDALLREGARHIAGLCHAYGIEPESTFIIGHRELKATECPGTLFDMDRLVGFVRDAYNEG